MKKQKIYNICVWTLLIDQIVKIVITLNMELNQMITVIPSFFNIYYVKNTGAAFSILEGKRYLLIFFAIVVFFGLKQYIAKNKIKSKLEILGLGLIMGGLVGNLVDRLLYGYVIDYLSFDIFKYSFPVFNIADMSIVIGLLLVIIDIIKSESLNKRKKYKDNNK